MILNKKKKRKNTSKFGEKFLKEHDGCRNIGYILATDIE